jgi:F-type H+-transporting ATPase subunit epsilon
MPELQCILVTPERTVRDETVDFVALPLFDGEIGIAPGHSPLIGRLGAGELRLQGQQGVSRYYVEGGFVEVLQNVVCVLTHRAVPAGELDPAVAAEQLQTVLHRPARSPEEIELRLRTAAQLRAQLRIIEGGSP